MGVHEDSYENWDETRRAPLLRSPWPAFALAAIACGIALVAIWRQQAAIDAGRAAELHAARVEHQLAAIQGVTDRTNARLRSTQAQVRSRSGSVAPLAARALRSVFTIEASSRLGSGFLAWQNDLGSFIITANHVVSGAGHDVQITRKGASWSAYVVARDPANDLALLRANGRPANAKPLWQKAVRPLPRTGQELILLGSPYGLGGTVTTGIISRITKKEIQTDAAANPGNSGGPAIDRGGHVVGILVAGGGENINFAVRIERACVRLRRCG
jgi:S1-C subfamily serine protease